MSLTKIYWVTSCLHRPPVDIWGTQEFLRWLVEMWGLIQLHTYKHLMLSEVPYGMPGIHTEQKGMGYWCHSEQSSSMRPGEVPTVPSMTQGIHVDTWTKALIIAVGRPQRVALLTKHAYLLANCIAFWAPADCTDLIHTAWYQVTLLSIFSCLGSTAQPW